MDTCPFVARSVTRSSQIFPVFVDPHSMRLGLMAAFGLAAVIVTVLAARNGRHSRPGSSFLLVVTFMGAGVALLNTLNTVQLLLEGRAAVWIVTAVQALVSPVVMGAVTCMALSLSDRAWRLSRRAALLLLAEPALIAVAAVTNPWLHLVIADVQPAGWHGMLVPVPGPAFWVNVAYVQLLIFGTLGRLIVLLIRATGGRRRIIGRVLGTFVPCTVLVLVVQALPFTIIDVTPLGQAITMIYIQIVLVRRMPKYIPIAHRHVFASISDAVTVVDHEGRILEANPAAHEVFRRIIPGLPADLTGVDIADVGSVLVLDLDERHATEQTITSPGGSGVDLHLRTTPLYDQRGACLGWTLVGRDVTEANQRRREAEQATVRLRDQLATIEALQVGLADQANRDPLTGLHNRRYLMEQLQAEQPTSLAIVDLDHFKEINDTYGHAAGDTVLVAVARLLQDELGPYGVVARYGGEEFVVAFATLGVDAACARVDRFREIVGRADTGLPLKIKFSAGVAEAEADDNSLEAVLRHADEALYAAKRAGRDRVERAVTARV